MTPGATPQAPARASDPSSAAERPADDLLDRLAAEEGGRLWLRRAGVLALVALLVGGGLFYRATHKPPPAARYVTAKAGRGDVAERVVATGGVQPVLQVNVGALVNGRVARVHVDFNSVVKKGEVLAEIDSTLYGAQMSQVQAQLLAQRAQLESSKANHAAARANFERIERLVKENLASRSELDVARGQFETTRANVAATEAQIAAVDAQLKQSQTNVGWTKILSPVDGVVIDRKIDPGATVVASFQAPQLFVLAQDLKRMRVLADVDEADVGKLKEGFEAETTVDAFPGDVFRGRVQQVRLSPTSNQGVVTYAAVVEVDNVDDKLRPGMTATVQVKTREGRGVVKVPNAALRFRPEPPAAEPGAPPPPREEALPRGKARVYVVVDETPGQEKLDRRVVDVGASDGIETEIVAGLAEGAVVATDENEDAKAGAKAAKKRP